MIFEIDIALVFLRGSSETDLVEGCGRLESAPTRSKRLLGSAQVVYYVAHQLMAAYPSTAIAWYTAGRGAGWNPISWMKRRDWCKLQW